MRRYTAIILLIASAVICADAYAREIKFEASVDRKVLAIGERAQLGLTFYGTQKVPAPDIGNIDGFEVKYLGPSTMMTVINGQVSSSITHMYTLLPLKIGKFQLGPFTFKYKGDDYTSNPIMIEVSEERVAGTKTPGEETAVSPGSLNLEDRVFLSLSAEKVSAYLNEIVPVTVKLYVNRLNIGDIQLPGFSQEGFSKAEFKEPKQYREMLNGVIYDVLEFKTHIFGTRPGDYRIGPATIKCNLIVKKRTRRTPWGMDEFPDDEFTRDSFFDDFFTRFERHPLELKSEDVPIIISPLPAQERPADFSGAVGDYQFIFNANPKKVGAGDPITLKMEINGKGNFNTVTVPKLDNLNGFKAYEPQVKTEESRKAFTQVLIPETEEVKALPKVTFTYFDPGERRYKSISHGPLPIEVEKGKEEMPPQVIGPSVAPARASPEQPREELTRDIIYIKEGPGHIKPKGGRLYKNKPFVILLPVPFLLAAAFSVVYAKRNRLKNDTRYARRSIAYNLARKGTKKLKEKLKAKDPHSFYDALFHSVQDYLGGRLNLPSAGITYDVVEPILRSKDVDPNILHKVRTLFDTCDRVKFGLMETEGLKMKDDFLELEEVVRYMERFKL